MKKISNGRKTDWMEEKIKMGLPLWLSGKESTYQCRRHRFAAWTRKIPHAAEQLSPSTITIEPVH